MSRIGRFIIDIPEGVSVENRPEGLIVRGPKGILEMKLNPAVKVELSEKKAKVVLLDSERSNIHGLTRSLVANMVKGVSEGWSRVLELSGTGFRAAVSGSDLQLNLGFSHPVTVKAPAGISFEVKEAKITVKGSDKVLVGEIAAKIRALKPVDPYKLKGFKYEGERVIKKAGKAAKAGA